MSNFEPSIASLRLVAKIVQTGKLTIAANQIHLSQSAASHALRILETQLGAPLFHRHRDGLHLSDAGRKLLPAIETILNGLDTLRSEAAGWTTLESGNLRIAAVPSLAATILPPLLRQYSERFPKIEIALFEGTDDEVHDWLQCGFAHVGFAALPLPGIAGVEILRDEWLALVPKRTFAARGSITLRELSAARFLMSGGGCERHIQKIFADAHLSVNQPLLIKQMPTIQAMVREGLGVSLVPSLSVAESRGCRTLPLRPRLFRKIGMLQVPGKTPPRALTEWCNLVVSSFA